MLLTVGIAGIQADERPTLGEFLGINGHTIQFRPELYGQICRKVRDYHSLEWDLGPDTDFVPQFPFARNRVDWNQVYGSWQAAGFETDVCIMFNNTPPDSWKDLPRDARAYGLAFARAFGPLSERRLVSSVEIGNEPGQYSDAQYRALFQSMALGLREGDPSLRIATCNITVGPSGDYEKSVDCIDGLDAYYDILNIHTYAFATGWPTWRRTHPEDSAVKYLSSVQALIDWRDAHAPGKDVWVTEFGWDASSKPNRTDGDFAQWEGNVSDTQQAQYLVRSYLLFSAMDVERAYLYFFNDSDEPSLHAASGVTRNFVPKPSFYAVRQLYRVLGDYRFTSATLQDTSGVYAYEYTHATQPERRIVVAWTPTGSGERRTVDLEFATGRVTRIETMAIADEPPATIEPALNGNRLTITATGSPAYIFLEDASAAAR